MTPSLLVLVEGCIFFFIEIFQINQLHTNLHNENEINKNCSRAPKKMYVIKRFVGHQNTGVECRSTPVQAWAHQ